LTTLRTTAAEKLLDDFKRVADAKSRTSDALIDALRQENAQLKQALIDTNTSSNATTVNRRDSVSSVNSAASNATSSDGAVAAKVAEMYRAISGLDLVCTGDEQWRCTLSGRKDAFDFEIALEDAHVGSVRYRPLFKRTDPICHVLPSYLTEEIVFGAEQLPNFYWRAFNFLMSTV
jgi:hypothetical protein